MTMRDDLTIQLLDRIDEGLIYLNKQQEIVFFNEKAREITGISLKSERYHPAGRIERGDIVVLITNRFGMDDGPLTLEGLSKINCHPQALRENDALIAVGVYDNPQIRSVHRSWQQSELLDFLELKVRFIGNSLNCVIDQHEKRMDIEVNGERFSQSYVKAYGHMVVIDGETGQIKFFQDKGYTIRRESVEELLLGETFQEKGNLDNRLNVDGMPLKQLFQSEQLFGELDRLYEAPFENKEKQLSFFIEINHRPMSCKLTVVYDQSFEGILIKFRDLSEMSGLLTERNEILKSLEQLQAGGQLAEDREALDRFKSLVGNSSSIKSVKYLANRATEIKSNVLITGGSGTGKTFLAKLIHDYSGLKGEFVEVNCAAIPQSLFESELFGYERGAFTGADRRGRKGYFEMANGGTLFLDEIGELPLDIQVKLLQVLQSKRFYKVGASVPTTVDVRVITATNQSLERAVQEGRFREDLFYRINVFPIRMPSLSERREDLYQIINDLLRQISKRMGMKEKPLSGEAFSRLLNHSWKGNIRELENVLERAMAVSRTNVIYPEHISMIEAHAEISVAQVEGQTLKARLDAYECEVLRSVLRESENKKEAIRILGLSKSTFYEKLKKHHLESELDN